MEARPLEQPALNHVGFVCGVVVHDQMYVEFFRHALFNRVEEFAKLFATVPAMHPTNDVAGLRVLRSKQADGSGISGFSDRQQTLRSFRITTSALYRPDFSSLCCASRFACLLSFCTVPLPDSRVRPQVLFFV